VLFARLADRELSSLRSIPYLTSLSIQLQPLFVAAASLQLLMVTINYVIRPIFTVSPSVGKCCSIQHSLAFAP